ncbi:hypothetical protein Pmar_PMAR003046 [Perkinsus marinus ATCC 50983]|uniref:Uncharacterized protein n=1 Tax=Perkinsus marinus (strain ATCC 50983 / TXsc) TaxID=423536 RepID=C5L464_PERM5|nr:hypothetical protein Pmar_PMAR003046 [Perkinsus marinus ATCC 50983]EER08479.1 hypothetical protein Pmar_PMAR003046 [Perkinsus marinus ATCC 50983]|eukprot:XP_002776663.1 hypothetical protein Pmar_PMAR003046 [Perkinsus marinus ATCC 50983]
MSTLRDVKDASVELMTCNEIAEVVAMYDMAGSRRNNAPECGKERIVFRARPNSTGAGLDDGDNEQQKEYKSIMAWSNKYAVISATEESDFDEPLEALTHYSASIALTGSTESLATDADTAQ